MALLFARSILLLGSLGFLVFGVLLLVHPIETMAGIGFAVPAGIPATEIRAFYGGAEIALGLMIGYCAWVRSRIRDGLVVNALVYGCIGSARLAGMLVDGSRSDFLSFALGTELGLAALSVLALWWLRGAQRN